ncbi:MAG: hypothetical protein LUQ40_00630 [Methanomicrobiales archaeon]|nr:hypothetical protein [Methanomicrobiales archaeon]
MNRENLIIFILFISFSSIIVPVIGLSAVEDVGTGGFREIPIPLNYSRPLGITTDTTGSIWFAISTPPRIVVFNPSREEFREFPIPNNATRCEIWSMVVDPDGMIWFGETVSNAIWVFNPRNGTFRSVPIPTPDAYPFELMFDAEGKLWFTELYGGGIGELSGNFTIREYYPPTISSGPSGFDFDTEGNIWFAQGWVRQVGWFNPHTGEFRDYPLNSLAILPRDVGIDPKGMIWVTDAESNSILRINPKTWEIVPFVTSFPEYGEASSPYFLKKDREGNFWVNERIGNKIGYLNTDTRHLQEIELPYSSTTELPGYIPPPCCKVPAGLPVVPREILSIAIAPDGNLWFTEALGNRIGIIYAPMNPPVAIDATPVVALPENRKAIFEIRVTSHLSDASQVRVTHNYPAETEGISVGSLFIPSSQITRGIPTTLQVPVTLPQSMNLQHATLTFSVHGGGYADSLFIRFVKEGEFVQDTVPVTLPVKQSIPFPDTSMLIGGALIIALLIKSH